MDSPAPRLRQLVIALAVIAMTACGSDHHVGPAPTGTVVGLVQSSLGGPVLGASVVVTPTGGQAMHPITVSSSGSYRVEEVPLAGGAGTITVSNVPGACSTPSPTPYTGLTNHDSVTVDVMVDCVTPVGTVTGAVTTQTVGVTTFIPNAKVTVTPTGGSAMAAATTSTAGSYTVTNVPVGGGGGTVGVSSLPANCSTPASVSYAGMVSGGTVTTNVAVSCTPTTGNLTITLTEPAGLDAGATVIAPDGTAYSIHTTQTLAGLAPGSYGIFAPTSVVVPGSIVNSVYVSSISGSPATVTIGANTNASVTFTLRPGSGSAWVTNQSGTAVQYSAAQLVASGSPVPPVTLSGLSAANALAFDGRGNLWIAAGGTGNDQIVEYASSELSTTSSPTPTLTLTSTNHTIALPQQITFDLSGDLWVANQIAGTVVEFTAAQLAGLSGTHTLVPAMTLTSADWGANGVGTIAFDVHGTLWVYGFSTGKIGVYAYPASSLTGSGAVTPAVTITNASLSSGPQTLAFDPAGDLWVTTNGSIVEFTPSQLAAGGAQTPAVAVGIPGSGTFINAMGFDDGGDLWLAVGGSSAIFAFTPSQLSASGNPTPAIDIASTGGSLSHPTAIGFDPHGVGVPLAGSRVAPRITRVDSRSPVARPPLSPHRAPTR